MATRSTIRTKPTIDPDLATPSVYFSSASNGRATPSQLRTGRNDPRRRAIKGLQRPHGRSLIEQVVSVRRSSGATPRLMRKR